MSVVVTGGAGFLGQRLAARGQVELIRSSGLHLLRLIESVLDHSTLEAAEAEGAADAFDLRRLIESVDVAGRPVPVLTLEHEAAAYAKLGQHD